MRSDLVLLVVGAAFVGACSSAPPPPPADVTLWTPPGQGDLEVADNHKEPPPKKAPRARRLEKPNQRNAKLRN